MSISLGDSDLIYALGWICVGALAWIGIRTVAIAIINRHRHQWKLAAHRIDTRVTVGTRVTKHTESHLLDCDCGKTKTITAAAPLTNTIHIGHDGAWKIRNWLIGREWGVAYSDWIGTWHMEQARKVWDHGATACGELVQTASSESERGYCILDPAHDGHHSTLPEEDE